MKDLIPAQWRKPAYVVFALLGVGFGALQTGFTTAEVAAPLWLTVAFQVYLYVGGMFGLVAATNTVKPTATIRGTHPKAEVTAEVIEIEQAEEGDEEEPDFLAEPRTPKHAA